MPHITEMNRIIKNDPEKAHAYFEQYKKALFSLHNRLQHGVKLLGIFREIQNILLENPANLENLHNAINFYHQNRELLGKFDIKGNRDHFALFQEIAIFNSTLECQFHDKLVEKAERILRDPSLIGETNRTLELISFAIAFSNNSTAKINIKPYEVYPLLRDRFRTFEQSTTNPAPTLQAEVEDCIIPTPQELLTSIGFFNETQPSKKRTRPEKPGNAKKIRMDDAIDLIKRQKASPTQVKIRDVLAILESSINMNLKTQCADLLRELSRFCRKEALGSPRHNYHLLHTARILSLIAVAWGNKNAIHELEYIGTKHEKYISSEQRTFIPLSFSSRDFPELLNKFLLEMNEHMPNVFVNLIEHLICDSKLSPTLTDQIKHQAQVVLMPFLEQNASERLSYNRV